jgi:DNA-binding winged helix-turn-helix (wHTH) protein/predicted Zn-dependent protease
MDGTMPAPEGMPPARYGFADLRLEADGTLLRGGTALQLTANELTVLRFLLSRAGEIVSPLELKRALFGEGRAAGDRVAKCVASLRARLQPTECIQSVYKRGYRISIAVHSEPAQPAGTLPRLAILPVSIGYGVPEYLGSGVLDQTIALLHGERCKFASLIARDSVHTMAKRGLPAREIGLVLHADLVLACTLNETGRNRRLRAEMIRVEDAAQLWTEDMLAQRAQTQELAAKLASLVATRMQGNDISISAAATEPEGETSPIRGEANELYLRAHHEWQTFERHRMQDAMQRLLETIEADPSLVAARVDLGYLGVAQGLFGYMPARTAAKLVHRAAERMPEGAAEGDALLPPLGWTSFHFDRNLAAARRAFERSAHLAHEGWITRVRTLFALSRRRFDEAIDMLRAAIRLDPYSPGLHAQLGWALHLAGEADASATQVRTALAQFADEDSLLLYGAIILAYNGEAARACELAQELTARRPHVDLATVVHAYALACARRTAQAYDLLERLQWLGRERFVLNTFHAAVYVTLGEPDAALEELRIANENRCPWFFEMLADPRLRPLWGRPEFEALRGMLDAMETEAARETAE